MNSYVADALRLVIAGLYGLMLGQIIWWLFVYRRLRRRKDTPAYKDEAPVSGIVVPFLIFAGEGVGHHFLRLSERPDWLLLLNITVFIVANIGVRRVLNNEAFIVKRNRRQKEQP